MLALAGAGPLEFEGLALPDLLGWATQPGLGTATTIGGAAGQVVTARTPEELAVYASSPEPLASGLTTDITNAAARAASTALPPSRRMFTPVNAAK